MKKVLYIIGNGFDLAHNMKTGYGDFKSFCEKQPKLYQELQRFYGDILHREGIKWWYQFENNLGKLDYEYIMKSDKTILASSNLLTFLTNHIRIPFAEWLKLITIPNVRRFNLEAGALFFTFNYTSVLEDLYHVRPADVFHVHGHLKNPVEADNLIIGHNFSERELFEDFISRYPNRTALNMDIVEQLYVSAAKGGKNVNGIINRNEEYFNNLLTINTIICIGFSFNDFDMPYLKRIFESNADQTKLQWQVYYYDRSDEMRFQNQLQAIGVDKCNIITRDIRSIYAE